MNMCIAFEQLDNECNYREMWLLMARYPDIINRHYVMTNRIFDYNINRFNWDLRQLARGTYTEEMVREDIRIMKRDYPHHSIFTMINL